MVCRSMPQTSHIPILVTPIVQALVEPFLLLESRDSHYLLDCTLGGGGHTSAFLRAFAENPHLKHHRVLALDQDLSAIRQAQEHFRAEIAEGRLELVHAPFGGLHQAPWMDQRVGQIGGMMADLGFSSDQLNTPERGLSFQSEGPLDMRLDTSRGQTCRELLSEVSERELERLLTEYGEERFSRRIASAIIEKRRQGSLPTTTQELSRVIVMALPPFARHGRIHAATRTFQALRIAVNDELTELESLLENGVLSVRPGGRIAILSFHSLEDRRVKERFKDRKLFSPLTKKAVQADLDEISNNPRARSAKLRMVERLKA